MRMFSRRPFRIFLLLLLFAALIAGVSLTTYRISQHIGLAETEATGRYRLDLYEASLEREIGKYAYFVATLDLQQDVIDLLLHPKDPILTERVNTYLTQLNERAGTLVIYIMDDQGNVLVSSNRHRPDSYVGENLSFRPYFHDAMATGKGRFFGIGTTRGEPGYYLSSALIDSNHTLGVAVVKISLEQLEESWSTVEVPALVSDENGIVILSSVPDWKFTALRPIDETTRRAFDRTLQYNRRFLRPFDVRESATRDSGARLVWISRSDAEAISVYPIAGKFLAQARPLRHTPWTLTVFSRLDQIDAISINRAAVAGIATVFLCILALMINQRRHHRRDRLAAKEKLQKVYNDLEFKIKERTVDLFTANQELQSKIAERITAERTLRAAQDELVQAGKLVVIGQLSAGIAHELNQPLAALRTLSGNTARFLERGDLETVRSNLARMAQIVDRMGTITSQLKAFAHKSSGAPQPVDVRNAVIHAIALLDQRLQRFQNCRIVNTLGDGLIALCDSNRLEQVIVNLIGNALDAMTGQDDAVLEISATADEATIHLRVRDTGPGLSREAQERLFEPFFTTKDTGLGLGLVISAGIINNFGGTLSGANHPDGGAVFTLDIPRAQEGPAS